MTGFGKTPLSTTTIGTNQFPATAAAAPDTPNGDFTAVMSAFGSYEDSNNNPMTAIMMQNLWPLIVQSNHAVTSSGGKTLTCQFNNKNLADNTIIVSVGMGEVEVGGGSPITLAITDSNGNTYVEDAKGTNSTTQEAAIFRATKIKADSGASANTITVTIAGSGSSNTGIGVEIYEVFGLVVPSGVLDQNSSGNNAGSTSVTTGAITPQVPMEMAFMAIAAAGGTITPGSGWTLDSTSLSPVGGLGSFGAQSQFLTSMASITPAASLSASNAWAAAAVTYRPVITPIGGTVTTLQGSPPWRVNAQSGDFVDGAITTIGTKADAADTTSTNTDTLMAFVKGLVKIFASVWDSTNNLFATNIKQIGGNAVVTGTGAGGSGIPRVTVSNDSTVGANSATGSAVPANAFYLAGDAATSLPTAATAGNLTGAMVDKFGRQVVLVNAMRDLVSPITQLTLTSTTTETTLITAVASTFLDIVSLVVVNTSATVCQVDFRDSTAGTIRATHLVPPTDERGISLPVPLPQNAVNNNWTVKCGTSVASIIITGSYISNK